MNNASEPNNFPGAENASDFLIVGIGASAGGVSALQDFFQHVPADSGIAYVVILHLSPDYDSQLTRVLQRSAGIPVEKISDKSKIQPDRVYVVSPNQHLVMDDGFITANINTQAEERRAPVDILFRTLAEAHGARAVCVILSGTGANGSMGLKRIKELGGVAFVQNPKEAEFNEMPRNAIATELVDEVLSVREIPARIIAYRNSRGKIEIADEVENRGEDQYQALRDILNLLRHRTGHDFSNYKRPTLLRRIERRINIRNLPSLPTYVEFIHQHAEETTLLLKDLLISVTNFFRDKKAFDIVEKDVLPEIIRNKTINDQVRIWIPGCATGEEAYSIAMLCAEQTQGVLEAPKIQVFATDIDDAAIAIAREGLYTNSDAADISPERLRRFFNKEGEGFRIRREIRETILFASHNFLKDPPFSRLDLISCRNLLIYLNHVAQQRIMETFHFALKPGGFLFLGTSESVDGSNDFYATFNRENHIFKSREVTAKKYPVPESVPTFRFTNNWPAQRNEEGVTRPPEHFTFAELHQRLLEEYAPPSAVINEEYEIVHLSERVGRYFEITGGEPTKNLLKLIRPELRLELRSALFQALKKQAVVEARNVPLKLNGQTVSINVQVRPVLKESDTSKGFILVIFEEKSLADEQKQHVRLASDEPVAKQLEEELMRVKGQLRQSSEHHEFQAEELKASNEELQAMNEELRSSAEELETSKEELQSINEELRTVNQELKVKIEETNLTSNNLQNLINSSEIGTIFLDRAFRVALFTPAVCSIFNLITADNGRPITDITHKLTYHHLIEDAEAVIDKLTVVEREVTTVDDRAFMMRLLPYRTYDDRINGVVITFFDITGRKQVEEALRRSEEENRILLEKKVAERTDELRESKEQYGSLVENLPDVITRWDRDLKLIYANAAFESKSGVHNETLYGKSNLEMGQPEDIALSYMDSLRKAFDTGESVEHFNSFPTPKGVAHFYSRIVPEKNDKGEVQSVLGIARDITALKKSEDEVFRLKDEIAQKTTDKFLTLCNSIDEGFAVIEVMFDEKGNAVDCIFQEMNPAAKRILGTDLTGRRLKEDNPEYEPYWFNAFGKVIKTGEPVRMEQFSKVNNKWLSFFVTRVGNAESKIATIFQDITSRKQFEQELSRQVSERTMQLQRSNEDLRQFAHVASHDLKEPVRKIQTFNNRLIDEYGSLLPDRAKSYSNKIGESTERMISMIEGVLRYSKLDSGGYDPKKVDLNATIRQIQKDLEVLTEEKAALISAGKLPTIMADPTLIYQLFYNLILNSLKFSKQNQPSRITIAAEKIRQGELEFDKIIVADNGIGFEAEFAEDIFKAFTRLHPADEYEGTGFGLALCQKIIQRHGGTITANGKPDEGAVFTILLPISKQ